MQIEIRTPKGKKLFEWNPETNVIIIVLKKLTVRLRDTLSLLYPFSVAQEPILWGFLHLLLLTLVGMHSKQRKYRILSGFVRFESVTPPKISVHFHEQDILSPPI